MARPRRTATRRTASKAHIKPWHIILMALIIAVGYLYNEGYFDRWLADYGLASQPTPVAVGGGAGPAISLPKAYAGDGEWYQIYFTKLTYPERASERSGGVDAALVVDIDQAQQSVKVAAYDFDLPDLTDALLRAKARGVVVQLVIDGENLGTPAVADLTGRLQQAGIPITFDQRPALMHNKFIVIDDRIMWTGSMNLTVNGVYRNNNNFMRTSVPPLVANYRQRFSDMFAGKLGSLAPANTPNPKIALSNGVTIENYFSPSDGALQHILPYLDNAQHSIKMMIFSFTEDKIADSMIALHQRGGDVQVVMEARSVNGTGSEYAKMQAAGVPILADGNCYIMHHKVMIVDDRIVITGSYNFTASAERSNDENLLIINDPTLAQFYLEEWNRVLAQAQQPTRCGG